MVEHPVQHDPDAVLVEGVAQPGEGIVIPQAAIHPVVVGGVVAVLGGLEHRPQVNSGDTQLL